MRSKFKWIFTLLLALTMQFSFAQEKTVTGVVSDATGTLPGANVVVKGTTRGAQTDVDGKYSISAKPGEVLVFSFVGMSDSSVTVGASNTINVTLEQGVRLSEVIVEGYRNTTKASTVVAQTTVNSKTIENRPNASFVQTLQGQVAGLNISTGTGQPGARSTVVIRGLGSINGSTDPLYVIDGIPTNGDNFRSLNPEDIASATVLKDAAALAIYGNRGSNGVIVITTRRGGSEDGKMQIRYSVSTGFTHLQRTKYSFANAQELLTIERDFGAGRGNFNPATGAPFTDAEIAAYTINTDWVDYFFRDAVTSNHQLSIETGGKALNSYTSVGYTDQQGILLGTGMKRFSLRSNVSGRSADDKFTYDTSLSLGFSKNNQATSLGTGSINQNYVLGATLGAPYIDPSEYQNSQQLFDLYGTDGTLLYTPLFLIDKLTTFDSQTDEMRILASTDVSYEVLKNFKLRSKTGADITQTKTLQWQHPVSFNSFVFQEPGEEFLGTEAHNDRRDFRFTQLWQANYNNTFGEKHTVDVIANSEYNFAQVELNNLFQRGLDPRVWEPGSGTGWIADVTDNDFYGATVSAQKLKYNLVSYFGAVDYDYDKRYGFAATLRYDGTSRFIGDRTWGTFWSVAGRWNINNESFLKDSNLIQVLKLRASYGTVGNQRILTGSEYNGINPPLYADIYQIADNIYNGQPGLVTQFGYDDLRWETTKQANIGLDFELQKNRLVGSVDLYDRQTIDLFNNDATSPVTGTTGIQVNSDTKVINKGIELSLSYDLIRNQDFKFTVRANWAYNDNKVENVEGGFQESGNIITYDGGMVYEFFLIPYAGVNPDNGELLFVAADGTLTENPNPDTDRVRTGKNDIPVYQGAFGFDLDYKGFFATTSFTYAAKSYRLDFDLAGLYDPGQLGQFVVSDDMLNAWTTPGQVTNVPSLNAFGIQQAIDQSDRFLVDASYIRVRNVQVGYKFPKKALEKTFIDGLTFYAQGENLYTWSKWKGFDAESDRASDQGQYPTPRIISIGMDLRF